MAQPTTRTTPTEQATELYAQLKPEAVTVYLDHILSRTPAELQNEMKTLVADDISGGGGAPDPNTASVANGASVPVLDALDAPLGSGTAMVSASVLTAVKMAAARSGMQQQGDVHRGQLPPRR